MGEAGGGGVAWKQLQLWQKLRAQGYFSNDCWCRQKLLAAPNIMCACTCTVHIWLTHWLTHWLCRPSTASCPWALQKNHLSGLQRKLLKVSFYNVQQLMEVRKEIQPTVNRNSKRSTMADAVAALAQQGATSSGRPRVSQQLVGGWGAIIRTVCSRRCWTVAVQAALLTVSVLQ